MCFYKIIYPGERCTFIPFHWNRSACVFLSELVYAAIILLFQLNNIKLC